jgi:hypothetical protein
MLRGIGSGRKRGAVRHRLLLVLLVTALEIWDYGGLVSGKKSRASTG